MRFSEYLIKIFRGLMSRRVFRLFMISVGFVHYFVMSFILDNHLTSIQWSELKVARIAGLYQVRRTVNTRETWVGNTRISCSFPSYLPPAGRGSDCSTKQLVVGANVMVDLIDVPTLMEGDASVVIRIYDDNHVFIERGIDEIRDKYTNASKFRVWVGTIVLLLTAFVFDGRARNQR